MPEQEIAILTRGLCKEFGKRSVLRRIDLTIPAGQCIGLIGANGAGKTTLLRCLATVVRPTAGEVLWFGEPAMDRPERRRLVGMVAHESRVYPQLTLRENLMFAARMCGVAEPARNADQLLGQLGLASQAGLRPTQISRGMQQRMAVARALIHEPPILLLDEPFASLDADGVRWLEQTLLGLKDRGRTICFSSHDQARTRHLADEVFELHAGRLHAVGWRHTGEQPAGAGLKCAA